MWKKLKRTEIFTHPRITLLEDDVELPDGSAAKYLSFARTNDSVTIICVKGSAVLLSREYSYPVDEVLYQLPGGKVESDESAEDAARRELKEETGYAAKSYEELGWYYVNNRRTKSKMYVVLATDLTATIKEGGDAEEDIESEWVPVTQITRMIASGEIVNYSVLAAWSLYLAKRTD
jgi:8-oxo-dGTP pyrophosphatase MutT (NUDIX family)